MLAEYLQKVITIGGNELEIDYRDGKEWFTAFKGPFGFGIGSLDSAKAKPTSLVLTCQYSTWGK